MNTELDKLYDDILGITRLTLAPYMKKGAYRQTEGKRKCCDIYYIDKEITKKDKNEGFIMRIRQDVDKINICLGQSRENLNIPKGYPRRKRDSDQYAPNQWEFDIYLDKPYDWPLVFLLAVQVAEFQQTRNR